MKKIKNLSELSLYKEKQEKFCALTAYDFQTAKILDQLEIQFILVGDSLANNFLGLDDTRKVGMQEMIYHTQVVARAAQETLLVSDLPFMAYQVSQAKALENIYALFQAGAQAFKLEGHSDYILELTKEVNNLGLSVISHLGFTPQLLGDLSKPKIQGKAEQQAQEILQQAQSLEEAGSKALVLELIPERLAQKITEQVSIPTIGIGAGKFCDGQILVTDDVLGRNQFRAKFIKNYTNQYQDSQKAISQFIQEVKTEKFPAPENSF